MPPFPAYPVVCGLSTFLVLLPLPWHWKARNTGTLLYIGWTVVGNLVFLANTIVWHGQIRYDPAPVWCDISTKLVIGGSVGITAASLCINRRLYNIATIKNVAMTRSSRRREIIIDLLLGIALPVLVMALHYVVQGHRYDIIEDVGCWPATYNTLLAVPMILMWPIIIGIASFVYAGLSIRAFLETRRQFSQVLSNSHSGINISRYFRLMALSSTEMLFSLPFSIYLLVNNLKNPQYPWISWEDTHQQFSKVVFWPMILIKAFPQVERVINISLWAAPVGGFVFFLWFGIAAESVVGYMSVFWVLVRPFGIKPRAKTEQPGAAWYVRSYTSICLGANG
ncbi:fungal pheromone STE3G-protein-coupled receptor [Ceratobasidium sp. AG-I]|nr:fungal pheromone STE3G-protein-coupled receptor [Ceratobasidium sp. AG-I]